MPPFPLRRRLLGLGRPCVVRSRVPRCRWGVCRLLICGSHVFPAAVFPAPAFHTLGGVCRLLDLCRPCAPPPLGSPPSVGRLPAFRPLALLYSPLLCSPLLCSPLQCSPLSVWCRQRGGRQRRIIYCCDIFANQLITQCLVSVEVDIPIYVSLLKCVGLAEHGPCD